jgi:hypothetical protein
VNDDGGTPVLIVDADGSVGANTSTSADRRLHAREETAATNTVIDVMKLTAESTGTPANGIGVGVEFEVETAATNNEILANIDVIAVDVTATSEDGAMVFSQMAAGSTTLVESLRLQGNLIGFYGTTPVAQAAAMTAQDTSITHAAPGTPDFALQALVDSGVASAWGFATQDEGHTLLQVVLNLQTRVAELEAALDATTGVGLVA